MKDIILFIKGSLILAVLFLLCHYYPALVTFGISLSALLLASDSKENYIRNVIINHPNFSGCFFVIAPFLIVDGFRHIFWNG